VFDEGVTVFENGKIVKQISFEEDVVDVFGGKTLVIVTDDGIRWSEDSFTPIEVQAAVYNKDLYILSTNSILQVSATNQRSVLSYAPSQFILTQKGTLLTYDNFTLTLHVENPLNLSIE
jgi:hypothetical protein